MKKLALLSLLVAPLATACTVRSSSSSGYESGSSSNVSPGSSIDGVHSSSLDTDQMSASMSAQSDGATLQIYASVFERSTSEGVLLDQGDFFTATTGSGDPLVLVREQSPDPTVFDYSASLPAASSAQDVTIAFVRQSGRTGAPRSIVHVPAPFSIVLAAPQSIRMTSPFSIQVSPVPSDSIVLEATGTCLEGGSGSYYDPNTFADGVTFDSNGNASIDPNMLAFLDNDPSYATGCDLSFFVSDVIEGSLDPQFAGGVSGSFDVEGLQKRGFQTTVSP
ncbi:MAG: hypothetical protein ABI183_19780 [Polyangiaceae bacterium]